MKSLIPIVFTSILLVSGSCFGQSSMTLKDSLELELRTIVNSKTLIHGNMMLDKLPTAPPFMICDNYDSLSFHHIQLLPKKHNTLKPIAEALFAYDRANNGLNNWDIHQFIFLEIFSTKYSNFKALKIGQDINHVKNELKDLIVRQIDNQENSELVLSNDEFNIVLWHNESTIEGIRIQRKCID